MNTTNISDNKEAKVQSTLPRCETTANSKIVYRTKLGIWVYFGTDINALLYNPDRSPKWSNPTTVMQLGDSYGLRTASNLNKQAANTAENKTQN